MPALKIKQFENHLIDNSKIGRAFSHPARLRILELIVSNEYVRNTELVKSLQLSQTSVSNHIQKLKEAGLIKLTFSPNSSYCITLTIGAEEKVKDFINDLFG